MPLFFIINAKKVNHKKCIRKGHEKHNGGNGLIMPFLIFLSINPDEIWLY